MYSHANVKIPVVNLSGCGVALGCDAQASEACSIFVRAIKMFTKNRLKIRFWYLNWRDECEKLFVYRFMVGVRRRDLVQMCL